MGGALAGLFISLPVHADEEPVLLQDAVAAYRAGRPFDALEKLGALIEQDPSNSLAKNYIWTITRKIQKDDTALTLSPREREEGAALAESRLAERRRRSNEILNEMRNLAKQSSNFRSPADILEDMRGAHRFLGRDLEGDLAQAQARDYMARVVANLSSALEKNVFLSKKDHLRAEGYRAYLKGDSAQAIKFWEAGLREDPKDKVLAQELGDLKALLSRREKEEKIGDLTYQAKAHFRAGDYAEALAAWGEIQKLDPRRPGVAEQSAAARAALEKSRLQKKLKEGINQGVALYKNGDVLGAAQEWLNVLMQDPGNEEARGWLVHAGRKLHDLPAERTAPPPSAKAAAPSEISAERRAGALEHYKEGIMHYSQGELDQAVAEWKEALKGDPGLSRAREALRQAEMEISLR
jgi:tetratricopeptide (TPR) repeat protein